MGPGNGSGCSSFSSCAYRVDTPVSLLAVGQGPLLGTRGIFTMWIFAFFQGCKSASFDSQSLLVGCHYPVLFKVPPVLKGRGLCRVYTSGSWDLWEGMSKFCPPHPCIIAILGSVFTLIAGSTFKNKAEAGPWGGSLQEAEHGAAILTWHWPNLMGAFSYFAKIVQRWKLSSQFRKE